MEVGLALGGAVLSSAFNIVFDRMTNPKFLNLFRGRIRDDQLFKKLKTTLLAIHAVLDDAENKQTANRHVKEWLTELCDTVYYAEDLVDEINTEAVRLEVEGEERSATNMVSHLSDEFLKEMIPKIEEVVTTLEYFVSQIDLLGLERDIRKKDISYRLPSSSLVNESNVYGRDNEREKLIQIILSNDPNGNNVRVIPIVGMGGVGKTTLAQIIFGDEKVKKHFNTRAWVCVSEKYDAFKITKTLVKKTLARNDTYLNYEDKDDFDMLQIELKEGLAEKRFLIVLDDIWNDNYNDWDNLKAPLTYGRQGSIIIVTTRNEKVAFTMGSELIHHLEPISDEDCWSLFKKHAFDNSSPFASLEFEKIGKEIVKKCKGLPLAVKTLGGLLRSKLEVKEWDDISRNDFWSSMNTPNDVLPVLKLSYDHLPSHLKLCFAFCAVFPKNYPFNMEELVLLWMANDLLQHQSQNDKSIEDVGLEYFNELKSRSFFQKVSDKKYSMHDLVNDLARSVCGRYCIRFEDYQHGEIPSEARHASYMSELYDTSRKFKSLAQLKRLRTFCPVNPGSYMQRLNKMFLLDIFSGLKCLRVLSLCGYEIKELPDSICNLRHLRYLNLSSTYIKQLPNVICSLCNLQTLLLLQCIYLHELPMDLTKLVSLRHLGLRGTELRKMPSHVSRLKNLQNLSCFIVDKSPGTSIKELGKLHLHGHLKIMGLQNVISCTNALQANLRNKNNLEDLVLQWSRNTDDSQTERDILDKLQPHTNLKSLTIEGYGGTRFPDWLADDSFCNIVSLCLTNCMNCFSLPALGHLGSLKSLTIKRLDRITKIGQEFYGDGSFTKPFQSLLTLRIEQMFEWEQWDTSANVGFSCLVELYIVDCPKLIGKLPSQLLCLREFEVSGCLQLVFPDDWMSIPLDKQVGLHFHLPSLQYLRISDMPNLQELPEGLLRQGLEELNIQSCHSLVSSSKVTTHINKMILKDCPSLVSLPIVFPSANIKELDIANCIKFEFPTGEKSEGSYISLEHLVMENAGDSFSDMSLSLFTKLLTLEIHRCESLIVFPVSGGIQNLTLLHRLEIWNCNNLLSFPNGGLPAPNLQYFGVIRCKKLKSLPERMDVLHPSLRDLFIINCPEIESFPKGRLPSSLESLDIISCEKLIMRRRHWGLQRLPALREFSIGDDYEESFPNEGLLPSSLRVLEIQHHKNLKTLNDILLRLTSLETLRIFDCPKLQSLPEEGLPTSLSELDVKECPLLKPHIEGERGKYWPSIAHISCILVDNELIS